MKLNQFKRYRGFIKAGMLDTFAYKFQIYGWLLGDIFSLIVICILWIAIYDQSTETIINGMSFKQMITYVVNVHIISQLVFCSQSFFTEGSDIREGNIAINLTKPINYRYKLLSQTIGTFFSNFLMLFLPLYIIATLILYFGFGCDLPQWYNILFFLLSAILSMLIYDSINFTIGQAAFFTGSLFGIMMIKDTIISFLAGSLIPLNFLPSWIQITLRILPFSSSLETPTLILLNYYSPLDSLIRILIQLAWVFVLEIFVNLLNKGMIKHVVSAGG